MPSQRWTPRHILAVALTAAVTMGLVSATLALGASLGGAGREEGLMALTIRMGVSVVVAIVLMIQERRRKHPSVREALTNGFEFGVLCVAMIIVPSTSLPAVDLWLRGVAILLGLPGLEVLTHLIVRGGTAASPAQSVRE